MAKKVPEINSSSQADIAFLLLCFFLMTTTMEKDSGIMRRLPPLVEQDSEKLEAHRRNVLDVFISEKNVIGYKRDGRPTEYNVNPAQLKEIVKDFMTPHPNNESYPETEIKENDLIGEYVKSKGVISLKSARGTSYAKYITVQNELTRAFNEMRDEMSKNKFHKPYNQLTEPEMKAINEVIPVSISEAEPWTMK